MGVRLTVELNSEKSDLRKYLTVQSYQYSVSGKKIRLKRVLRPSVLKILDM